LMKGGGITTGRKKSTTEGKNCCPPGKRRKKEVKGPEERERLQQKKNWRGREGRKKGLHPKGKSLFRPSRKGGGGRKLGDVGGSSCFPLHAECVGRKKNREKKIRTEKRSGC